MEKQAAAHIAEYIQVTNQAVSDLYSQVTALQGENQKLQSVQKTASEKVNPVKVGTMLDRVVEAGFILPSQKEASFQAVVDDPACLVPFLEKLAENHISKDEVVKSTGSVEKTASAGRAPVSNIRESDRFFERTFG